jgi:pimeloyl-ACP methyl ester carboxylesterase
MDIILIPGLWLDASSWDNVVPVLEQAGHRTHALTLPGMESKDADRSKITVRDHVDAVVDAIDAIDPANGKLALVGHSAGSAIAYAAVDARPDRVARVLYVGGFPGEDGDPLAASFAAENGEVPLPPWSVFEEADLRDLDDAALAEFRARAIPAPEHVTKDPLHLSADERRYAVPATAICPEYSSEQLKEWIAEGELPEFTKLQAELQFVDVPTSHWPQFTKPVELANAINQSIAG